MAKDFNKDTQDTRLKPGLGITRPAPSVPKHLAVLTVQGRARGEERVFRLHKQRIVVGTVVSADVRLTGEGISPIHAVIEVGKDGGKAATVFDLASDTGVFVDGAKVVTRDLKGGEEITVGRHRLRFSLEDPDHPAAGSRYRESEGRKLFINPNEDLSSLLLEDERQVHEIFDYKPTSQLALETVMSWRNTILGVEHFVRPKEVTIGNERKNDFGIPPLLSASRFPIVSSQGPGGDDYVLNLDGQMKGVIHRGGQLFSVEQARSQANRGPLGYSVPLAKGDFAKISVGEVDFYFSFTSAPPRLKMPRFLDRDPLFLRVVFGSLLLTIAMMAALRSVEVTKPIDAEQLPERIATILYQPEKYSIPRIRQPKPREEQKAPEQQKPTPPKPAVETRQTPKAEVTPEKTVEPTPRKTTKVVITPNPRIQPKPAPKQMNVGQASGGGSGAKNAQRGGAGPGQSEAREGEGARSKGAEGTRGSKTSRNTGTPQTAASRLSPQRGAGRGSGASQVLDNGNVDLMKGFSGKIQNLLGNSAANLGAGGNKVAGFGGFTTQGGGGLAMSGDGRGGGGTADTLAGGLSDKGRGGGRVGTGLGASGTGNGIVGGQSRVVIRSGGPEEAVVMGAIDADAVEQALLAHKDEFRLCYEREINAETPNLAGRVSTTFVIGSSGRVTQAGIESSSLKHSGVERCVINVIKRIDFPVPRGGGVVQVTYPFKFSAGGK